MRRLLIVLLSLLAVLLFASPAIAQEEPILTSLKDAREGEGYEVYKNGTFVIGADVVVDCNLLFQEVRQTGRVPTSELLRQVEVCKKAGFPLPGSGSLPDTGGSPFFSSGEHCSWVSAR